MHQGINVWGAQQETLEKQALTELEIFANECTETDPVSEEVNETENQKESKDITLDINSYIKKQEEFKKRQDFKRSLDVSDHSRSVANKICDKYRKVKKTDPIKARKCKGDNKKTAAVKPAKTKQKDENLSDSDYIPSDNESDYEPEISSPIKRNRRVLNQNVERIKDDGLMENYNNRLELYYKKIEEENELNKLVNEETDIVEHHNLKGGLKVPLKTWHNLYRLKIRQFR